PPFLAKSLYDVFQAHISLEADALYLIRPEVPTELSALVAKMMAKEPDRRFQTPQEVAQALTPFFKRTGKGANAQGSTSTAVGSAPHESPIETAAQLSGAAARSAMPMGSQHTSRQSGSSQPTVETPNHKSAAGRLLGELDLESKAGMPATAAAAHG